MGLIYVMLALPAIVMGLFITHEILVTICADRLVWFLFWTYVPVSVVLSIMGQVIRYKKD